MKRYITLLTGALLITTCSMAQQKMGWEAGLISTNYIGAENGGIIKLTAKPGLRAGFNMDFKLAQNLSLQGGLLFVTNGYRQNFFYTTATTNIQTIEMPLCLQFWSGRKKGQGFFIGGGPYIACNVSGQVSYEKGTSYYGYGGNGKISIGTKTYDNIRPLDIGGIVNSGYEFTDGIFFRGYYQLGFSNLSNTTGNFLLNRNFGLCVGYMIGTRPLYTHAKKGKRKINPVQKDD